MCTLSDTFRGMSFRFLVSVSSLCLMTVLVGLFWWFFVLDSDPEPTLVADRGTPHVAAENVLSPQSGEEEPTVEVLDYGFGDNNGHVQAVVLIRGNLPTGTAQFATASVNFLDEDGLIVATEALSQYLKWDGHELVIPVHAYDLTPGVVASIDPTVVISDTGMATLNVESIPPAESTEITNGFGGDYMATFALTNDTNFDWKDITVGVICYGDDEEAIGGGSAYPGPILAGKSIRLESSVTTSVQPSSCSAYAHPPIKERVSLF